MKALHNDKWVRFAVLSKDTKKEKSSEETKIDPQTTKPEEQTFVVSEGNSSKILDHLWGIFDELSSKSEQYPNLYEGVSPIILLILIKNLKRFDDVKDKNKERCEDLTRKAYSIYSKNLDPGAHNMDMYTVHIFSESYEMIIAETLKSIDSIKSKLGFKIEEISVLEPTSETSVLKAMFFEYFEAEKAGLSKFFPFIYRRRKYLESDIDHVSNTYLEKQDRPTEIRIYGRVICTSRAHREDHT